MQPGLLAKLAETYGVPVPAEDVMAYVAAVAAHPAYVARFAADLVQPGLRIPVTADAALFAEAVALGREVVWLHTFGERFADPAAGRPAAPPRLPEGERPHIPAGGAIPSDPDGMPDAIRYDQAARRLHVGAGYVERVAPEVWAYEVSGKPVLSQWFSYRGRDRSRPLIGDRRPPSPLGDIQPASWPAEYTTELLNLLNVLGRLVQLEPAQAELLDRICAAPLIPLVELRAALAEAPAPSRRRGASGRRSERQGELSWDAEPRSATPPPREPERPAPPQAGSGDFGTALAAARERGRVRAAQILDSADMLDADSFARRLGTTRDALDAMLRERRVLGLDSAGHGLRFPEWQVGGDGKPFDALPALFGRLDDPWAVYRFLVQHHPELDGLTGRDALHRGLPRETIEDAAESTLRAFA